MDPTERNPDFLPNKQDFANFLEPDHGDGVYVDKIEELVGQGDKRLTVSLHHIGDYDQNLRNNVMNRPMDFLPAWEEALKDFVDHSNFVMKEQLGQVYKIGFDSSGFGGHRLTPQLLMANSIGSLVCVEGIVTKVSLIRPKVMQTVHYCEATNEFKTQNYRDATSLDGMPTGAAYPTQDDQGNPLTTEFGLSTYMDHQTVFIQDMPERTEAGSMPQTVECILDDDLVDACKPGDRVQMIGIYRALAGRAIGSTSGRFKTVILANNVKKLGIDDRSRTLSVGEIKNIRKLAKKEEIFNLLSRSIAPSLYGHEYIKKAILLQLLGGLERNLDNGTHIRGDINLLMVGDPSCGKSQLLRAVMNISPLAINTTGRGSSGVGLTAAVTMDRDSGERRLEAGAMVLADRGIVCIDEFDKMSDADRTAIHEVMEQQTVTIAKAGIHTSLNARCSVIAAANPVYGMYDRTRPPHSNIALPDSLLSRFDLLFIVLDKIDTHIDRAISQHVLAMHLTPHNDAIDNIGYFENENEELEEKDVEIYAKNIPGASGVGGSEGRGRGGGGGRRRKKDEYLTIEFCKKFIEFAKKQFKPKLSNDACEMIARKYAELRDSSYERTLPITARCLETIIRLSTAHAKLRLSKTIQEIDVEEAMSILNFALTNDAEAVPRDDRKQRQRGTSKEDESDGSEEEDESDNNDNNDGRGGRSGRKVRGSGSGSGRGGKNREEKDKESEQEEDNDGDIAVSTSKSHRKGRTKNRRRQSQILEESDASGNDEADDDDAKLETIDDMPSSARINRNNNNNNEDSSEKSPLRRSKRKKSTLNQANVDLVIKTCSNTFKKQRITDITVDKLLNEVKSVNNNINETELRSIIEHLHKLNKIFYTDDTVHQM